MSVKSINDPNFEEVLNAGTYADTHAVTCSAEALDLYGADGYKAELNLDFDTKDDLFDGQQKQPEFAKDENKDDKQKALFRCQIAFGGAVMQTASAITVNLGNLGNVSLKGYGSSQEEVNQVKQDMERAAEQNPEQLNDALKYAKRDHDGNILATDEDVYNYEAEFEMACTPALSAEGAANIANGVSDPEAQSQLAWMKDVESGPNGNEQTFTAGLGGG